MATVTNDWTHQDSVSFNAVRQGWTGGQKWHLGYEYFNADRSRRVYVEYRKGDEAILRALVGSKAAGSGYHTIDRVKPRDRDKLVSVLAWFSMPEEN
ncbi:hypothetical protein [Mycolicibacterium phage Kashi_SSH1]|nr:hypothetical protein [Mycolicibacterium phage Kashi_SSH1]